VRREPRLGGAGRRRAAAVLAALALAAAGCGGSSAQEATVTVRTPAGDVAFSAEIADTPSERRRGLSGRSSIPERSGMLFLYDGDHRGGFWMKDTQVPLSIAFLDSGWRVLALLDMEPCRSDPCRVYDPGIAYRSALEVSQGALARLGVEVGDVLEVELER
jgi:uncharacterized membrane protein (UPF0127 family)